MTGNKKDRREGGREGGGRQSERIEGGNVTGNKEDRMEGVCRVPRRASEEESRKC